LSEEANYPITGSNIYLDSSFHDCSIWVEQGDIPSCAGSSFNNICSAADILRI